MLIFALAGLEAALSLTQLRLPAVSPYPAMNTNITISLMFRCYCKSVIGNSKKSSIYSISSREKEGVGVLDKLHLVILYTIFLVTQ